MKKMSTTSPQLVGKDFQPSWALIHPLSRAGWRTGGRAQRTSRPRSSSSSRRASSTGGKQQAQGRRPGLGRGQVESCVSQTLAGWWSEQRDLCSLSRTQAHLARVAFSGLQVPTRLVEVVLKAWHGCWEHQPPSALPTKPIPAMHRCRTAFLQASARQAGGSVHKSPAQASAAGRRQCS